VTLRKISAALAEAGLLATAFFLPTSIVGAQWGGALMAIGAVLAWKSGLRGLLPRGLAWPVLAFGAMCVLASLVSPAEVSWNGRVGFRHVFFVLLAPAAVAAASRPERALRRAVAVLFIAAFLSALLGLVQARTGFDLNHALGVRKLPLRVPSPMGDGFTALGTLNSRLTFSEIESAVVILALAVVLTGRGLWVRIASGVTMLGCALAVAATYSRAAWIGALAGAATLALGLKRRTLLALVGITVAAGIAGAAVPTVRARAVSAFQATANPDRLFMWSRVSEVISDYPTLGVGVHAYPIVASPYYDRHDPNFPMRTWAHDIYLTLMAETGVAGLVCYVWILVMVAALALSRRREDEGRAVRLGALGAAASLVTASFFHDVLYDGEAAMTLFFLAGLATVGSAPTVAAAMPEAERAPEHLQAVGS